MLEERLLIRSLALLFILWKRRLAVEVRLPIIAVSGSTQHVEDASLLPSTLSCVFQTLHP